MRSSTSLTFEQAIGLAAFTIAATFLIAWQFVKGEKKKENLDGSK